MYKPPKETFRLVSSTPQYFIVNKKSGVKKISVLQYMSSRGRRGHAVLNEENGILEFYVAFRTDPSRFVVRTCAPKNVYRHVSEIPVEDNLKQFKAGHLTVRPIVKEPTIKERRSYDPPIRKLLFPSKETVENTFAIPAGFYKDVHLRKILLGTLWGEEEQKHGPLLKSEYIDSFGVIVAEGKSMISKHEKEGAVFLRTGVYTREQIEDFIKKAEFAKKEKEELHKKEKEELREKHTKGWVKFISDVVQHLPFIKNLNSWVNTNRNSVKHLNNRLVALETSLHDAQKQISEISTGINQWEEMNSADTQQDLKAITSEEFADAMKPPQEEEEVTFQEVTLDLTAIEDASQEKSKEVVVSELERFDGNDLDGFGIPAWAVRVHRRRANTLENKEVGEEELAPSAQENYAQFSLENYGVFSFFLSDICAWGKLTTGHTVIELTSGSELLIPEDFRAHLYIVENQAYVNGNETETNVLCNAPTRIGEKLTAFLDSTNSAFGANARTLVRISNTY